MNTDIVKGLAIFGENGQRVMGSPMVIDSETASTEKAMFSKAKESEEGLFFFGEYLVLYKIIEDVCILLYAPVSENELMLSNALEGFYSAIVKTIKGPLNQKSLSKHYDEVFLLIDAFIYKTVLLTDSAAEMCSRIPKRTFEGLEAIQIPSKFSNVFKKAQKSFASSWFKK
ncbi:coatomer subunit zeta [Nematocida sp. AWRm77]|nr:coatomer subunit zeta [Nematocida sp. AWRm77]